MLKKALFVALFPATISAIATTAFAGVEKKIDRFTGDTEYKTEFNPHTNTLTPQAIVTISSRADKAACFNPQHPGACTNVNNNVVIMIGLFKGWKYLDCTVTYWLVDGKPLDFPKASHMGEVLDGGYVIDGVSYTNVPTEKLYAIGNAKRVEYKVCNDEYTFSSSDLESFRQLSEKLQGESKNP